MMDDVAHRWLSINLESEAEHQEYDEERPLFTAVIKPPGPHRPQVLSTTNRCLCIERVPKQGHRSEQRHAISHRCGTRPEWFADRDKRYQASMTLS